MLKYVLLCAGWFWLALVGSGGSRGFWWVLLVWFVVATGKFWRVLANSGGLCVLVRSGGLASSGWLWWVLVGSGESCWILLHSGEFRWVLVTSAESWWVTNESWLAHPMRQKR